VLDVDGTLTDGGISISNAGDEVKTFQAKDGLIIRVLPELKIKTVILTGRNSRLTQIRADELCITHVIQSVMDKAATLSQFLSVHNLIPIQTAYIGDDLNDYAAMNLCGFKACPSDAVDEIKGIADYVSRLSGGHGAVRDICEVLLKQYGRYKEFLKLFGAVKNSTG
jgi:3-deoxy-D-manno-octulosonate 8-phosphate phosphatase (KDO 8-P phosphatase)